MRPDVRPTYAAADGAILYQDGRLLNREWADRMLAYHKGEIAKAGISRERLRNNQRWVGQLTAAMATVWPEQKAAAE